MAINNHFSVREFLFQKLQSILVVRFCPKGVLTYQEVGGGGGGGAWDLTSKFGGKIWGTVRPSSPNERKNLGNSVTTRHKSWQKS